MHDIYFEINQHLQQKYAHFEQLLAYMGKAKEKVAEEEFEAINEIMQQCAPVMQKINHENAKIQLVLDSLDSNTKALVNACIQQYDEPVANPELHQMYLLAVAERDLAAELKEATIVLNEELSKQLKVVKEKLHSVNTQSKVAKYKSFNQSNL